jgi:glycine betaine/proline transport system substrate-binding protein
MVGGFGGFVQQGGYRVRKFVFSAVAIGGLLSGGAAHATCGDVTLAVFSWQSAEAMSSVDQFILKNGYGCNTTTVAGDTVPTITAMVEKGQPDVSPESTPSLLGDVYTKGAAEGRISQIGTAISDGEVSGWWIPQYLAERTPRDKNCRRCDEASGAFPVVRRSLEGCSHPGSAGLG